MIIEHNLDVIRNADWIIDLGPEGGEEGGRIVAQGTPEQVGKSKKILYRASVGGVFCGAAKHAAQKNDGVVRGPSAFELHRNRVNSRDGVHLSMSSDSNFPLNDLSSPSGPSPSGLPPEQIGTPEEKPAPVENPLWSGWVVF